MCVGGDVPAHIVDFLEELIKKARIDTALNMNAPEAVSDAGRDEMRRLEELSRDLADALTNVSDELQHFLDFEVPHGTTEDVALLALWIKLSSRLHTEEAGRRWSLSDSDRGDPKDIALNRTTGETTPWRAPIQPRAQT